MISLDDEVALERLVGSATYARGYGYARAGAVRTCVWSPGGTRVIGRVQGGASQPNVVTVTLTFTAARTLKGIVGTCSCPVEINCKHAVALLLSQSTGRPHDVEGNSTPPASAAQANGGPSPRRSPAAATVTRAEVPRPRTWADPLEAVIDSWDEDVDEFTVSELGLQFERLAGGASRSSGAVGIRVRPVVAGRSGNWIRTGISWASLDYFGYRMSRTAIATERLLLVKEFLALSRVDDRRTNYGYGEPVVMLESITSRRLWDLLGEARALGLPLVQSGRGARALTLASEPLLVTVDVRRTPSGARIEPRIANAELTVALENSLLIGTPAHALAWWGSGGDSHDGDVLGVARLATPVDAGQRDLLAMGTVTVPRRDVARLVREYVPRLRRRVDVVSSDESVSLPEFREATLALRVVAGDGHRVEVSWTRRCDGGAWHEELWGAPGRARAASALDQVIAVVSDVLAGLPEMFERTPYGERLAPSARLEGVAAARFIAQRLPLLEGVERVVVERTGALSDYREVADVPVVHLSGSSPTNSDWFDLSVNVKVGLEDVPFTDLFRALANGDSHLILPSGTFFSLDHDALRELARLIAEARALHDAPGHAIRLSRFHASLWEDFERLGTLSAQAREWEESVRALAGAGDRIEHSPPASLTATLRPYQVAGFNWLAYLYEHRLGGVLADDMGLGKTLQALALVCHVHDSGHSAAPFLVVAPTSVVGNWADECRRFAPGLHVRTISETGRRRATTLVDEIDEAHLVVTSYSLFRLEYGEYASVAWAGLFLDEAQFAKNRLSQAYQRAKSLPVTFKVAISGTPVENNLMELWSLFSIAAPGLFSSPAHFATYYGGPIEKDADAQRLALLRRRIRPLLLRRTKEQVAAELPEKQEQVLELELHPKHKTIYQRYLQRERQKVLGLLEDVTKNRFEIFRSLTLLRQASLDVSLVDEKHAAVSSSKLDLLMEMLDDIVSDGHRVLVFSQFTRFLATARQRLRAAGINHCYLDGRTRRRADVISQFRSGDAPVFLISLKAGGVGLNLSEADYCVLLDPWWNPATEAQAVDRIHRIGQTRRVMVYRLVAKDTIEEKVMALKAKKAALFASVIGEGGFEGGAMTADDIRELLS